LNIEQYPGPDSIQYMSKQKHAVTPQLDTWAGEFGDAYTDRNIIDWQRREPAFREMLQGLELPRVLEVGCNRGHNLVAVSKILGNRSEVVGLEPNPKARAIARALGADVGVMSGTTNEIPFTDASFDLVFTCTVLIHVPLKDLPLAMREIARVSRSYILCIEYFATEETPITYRGRDDLLWKRDFLAQYHQAVPGLTLLKSGYWGPEDGFDRSHWWLLEKT
jgi:pseudaminic acid biosynthesis-associated methylase